MALVPALGSLSLGIVVGWLVRFFLRRFRTFTPKTLGTVVTILVGGAVVRFLSADTLVWWWYPIGLLVGFVAYTLLALWALGLPRSPGDSDELPSPRPGPRPHNGGTYNGVLFDHQPGPNEKGNLS